MMHSIGRAIVLEAISQMPKENNRAREMQEAGEVGGSPLVPRDQTPEVLQPREQPFDLPAALRASQRRPSCVFARPRRFGAIISMPNCVISRSSSPSLS